MFDEIVGNDFAKVYLEKALSCKKVPNSLLFYGPEGVGKSLFAEELAKKLMYPNETRKIFPDLYLFYPEGKMHTIDSMRSLIEQSSLSPYDAESKVFIIQDAEMMQPVAANALLKTLEEPLLNTFIILITGNKEELIPTIVSRCFKIKFNPLTDEEIIGELTLKFQKTETAAKQIALLSNGSLGKAIELALQPDERRIVLLNILSKNGISSYLTLMEQLEKLESLYKEPPSEEEEKVLKWKKDVEFLFFQIFLWFRDLSLLKMNIKKLYFFDHLLLLQKQETFPSLKIVETALKKVFLALERNIKLKTCLEYFFLKINFIYG